MRPSSAFRASICTRSTAARSTTRDSRSKIGDGFDYVRRGAGRYDLIVLDLTDPGGPSEALYTPDFYRACAARLDAGGAMTLHIASPIAHPQRIRATLASLRQAFAGRHALPHVDSAVWRPVDDGVRVADARPENAERRRGRPPHRGARGSVTLRYYNGDMHRAALALPNFVRELVA